MRQNINSEGVELNSSGNPIKRRNRSPTKFRLVFNLNYSKSDDSKGYEFDGTGYFNDNRKGTVVLSEYEYVNNRKDELMAIVFALLGNNLEEDIFSLRKKYKWMLSPVAFVCLVYEDVRYFNLYKNSILIRTILMLEKHLSTATRLNLSKEAHKLMALHKQIMDMFHEAWGGRKHTYDPARYSWSAIANKDSVKAYVNQEKKVDKQASKMVDSGINVGWLEGSE